MICKYCGKNNPDGSVFCYNCGKTMDRPAPDMPAHPTNYAPAQSRPQPQQNYQPVYTHPTAPVPPLDNKPLSPWAYFGYQLLFAIPVVGFILLIVFSCGGTSNINLKNFARSYWCGLLVAVIICVVFAVLAALGVLTFMNYLY